MKRNMVRAVVSLTLLASIAGCAQRNVRLGHHPKSSPESRMESARQHERNGNHADALTLYKDVQRDNPNFAIAWHRSAVAHAKLGQFAESISDFTRARQLDPQNVELLNDYGYALYLQGQLGAAEKTLRQALAVSNSHERAIINLATVVGHQGRFDESAELYRHVADEGEVQANLAYLHAQRGNVRQALHHYNAALSLDDSLDPSTAKLVQIAREKQNELAGRRAGSGAPTRNAIEVVSSPIDDTTAKPAKIRPVGARIGDVDETDAELDGAVDEPVEIAVDESDERPDPQPTRTIPISPAPLASSDVEDDVNEPIRITDAPVNPNDSEDTADVRIEPSQPAVLAPERTVDSRQPPKSLSAPEEPNTDDGEFQLPVIVGKRDDDETNEDDRDLIGPLSLDEPTGDTDDVSADTAAADVTEAEANGGFESPTPRQIPDIRQQARTIDDSPIDEVRPDGSRPIEIDESPKDSRQLTDMEPDAGDTELEPFGQDDETDDDPIVASESAEDDRPIVREEPIIREAPTVVKEPVTFEKPIVVDEPAVIDEPAIVETPRELPNAEEAVEVVDSSPAEDETPKAVAEPRGPSITDTKALIAELRELGLKGRESADSVEAIKLLLNDRRGLVRIHAALALWRIEENVDDSVPAFIWGVQSSRPGLRSFAAAALAEMGPDGANAALPALDEALSDRNGYARIHVAEALGRHPAYLPKAASTLVECLIDENDQVRSLAAHSMAELVEVPQIGISALTEALTDPSAEVRAAAAFALGECGPTSDSAIKALKRRQRDKDGDVRLAAKQALDRLQTRNESQPASSDSSD